MRDEVAGSTALDTRTLRQIELPDEPVAGGLYWFDPTADPTAEADGEHELGGRIELPAGARVTLYTDGDAPAPDLSFLDAVPSDLPTALYLHGVTGDDVDALGRFTGLESLGLTGEIDDPRVADLVGRLPRLCVVALDGDGLTGAGLAALPAGVSHVTVSSRRLAPACLAALAGGAHSVETLGLGRVAVDGPLVDALVALRPQLRSVYLYDLPDRPDLELVERLLAAGLEVDGVSSAPTSTDRFARIVLDALSAADDPDDADDDVDGDGDEADGADAEPADHVDMTAAGTTASGTAGAAASADGVGDPHGVPSAPDASDRRDGPAAHGADVGDPRGGPPALDDDGDLDVDDDRPMRSLIVEAELDALVAQGRPVLVDLTATWCGPCQVLKPLLHEIDAELGDQLTVVAVDVDDAPWTEHRFAVQGIPTMVLLDEGRELGRISGAHPKRALLAMIAAALPSVSVPGAAIDHRSAAAGR
jgi:thioredoxin